MAPSKRLIASTKLTSAASSVVFGASNTIPQRYNDLLLVANCRTTLATTNDVVIMRFNGATTDANLSVYSILGNCNTASTSIVNQSFGRVGLVPAATSVANVYGFTEIYIPNYTSVLPKQWRSECSQNDLSSSAFLESVAGLWDVTTPITQIELLSVSGSTIQFAANSSFSLYGIKNS